MDDFSSLCRTCLCNIGTDNVVSIDDVYLLDGTVSLIEMLGKHTAIEWNESYPPNICLECLIKVEESAKFFEKCNQSNSVLSEITSRLKEDCETDIDNNNDSDEILLNQNDSNCEIITIKNANDEEVQIEIMYDSSSDKIEDPEDSVEFVNCEDKFSIDHEASLTTGNCFRLEKCGFCFMELEIEEFEEHKTSLGHFDNSSAILCPHCLDSSQNLLLFRRHLRTHNIKETKRHICKICRKVFKWKSKNFKEHMRMHSLNKEEKVICPDCGLLFSSMTDLQIHRGQEHAAVLAITEWECNYCERVFENITDFKKHTKEVHAQKDFHCIICGKDCKDRRTLYYHEQLHLDEWGIECSYCHKKLLTEEKLILHQRIHIYVKKKHVCNICNKGFRQLDKLEAHIRVHTGEKPFKCDFCEKAFNHQNNLWHHLRLHTGDTPYKCLFCSKEYSNSHSLKKHMTLHEKEKMEGYSST